MQQATPLPTTPERVEFYVQRANTALDTCLPAETIAPTRLHRAMRYSVLGAGKRIRPLFCYGAAEALEIPAEQVDSSACAVELIHAYSLIHDDLPAMDDDDLRRGRPTCHRAFDEATAILAGDALQALAFEVLAADRDCVQAPERRLAMVSALGRACGAQGMAGGQALDLEAVGASLELSELETMHRLKTGALIRCAVSLPALLGGDRTAVARLERYGESVGLAFQIHDDILDVEGATESIGKPQGSDQERGKPTFPSCLGIDGSRARASQLLDEALEALRDLPGSTGLLAHLARFTVERKR